MKLSQVTSDTHTRSRVRKNLLAWWEESSKDEMDSGRNWYSEAQSFASHLSDTYGVSGETAAGVISALSPNNKWERNKIDAEAVLTAVSVGVTDPHAVKVCTYNANKAKAFSIAMGDTTILKDSPKTYAFARNVGECDGNYVTIDKWHLRACQSVSKQPKELQTSVTPKQYRILQEETLKVARAMGVCGYVFQAVVWVTIRNRWGA